MRNIISSACTLLALVGLLSLEGQLLCHKRAPVTMEMAHGFVDGFLSLPKGVALVAYQSNDIVQRLVQILSVEFAASRQAEAPILRSYNYGLLMGYTALLGVSYYAISACEKQGRVSAQTASLVTIATTLTSFLAFLDCAVQAQQTKKECNSG